MSFQILFNKTGNYENMNDQNGSSAESYPPPYTEATNPCSSAGGASTSTEAIGQSEKSGLPAASPLTASVTIVSAPEPSPQLSPASSVAEELSALQRAHLHLYKRLQEVKIQTYAALVVVLLLAALVMAFLIAFGGRHAGGGKTLLQDLPSIASSGSPSPQSFRSGKALSASTASLVHDDNTLSEHFTGHGRHANERIDWNDNLENDTLLHGNESTTAPTTMKVTSTTTTSTTPSTTTLGSSTTVSSTPSVASTNDSVATIPHASTYKMSILIHKATVPNMDSILGKASDTFCDVYIDDVNVGSTTVIDNDNQPNWQYLFSKPFIVKRDSVVRIDLIDLDNLKKDHIGGTRVVVDDLIKTQRLNRPIRLFHGKGDIWVTFKLE